MNIFVTSFNPVECAQALDDRRLVKMVLETAQLLSTTHHMLNTAIKGDVYKPTHINHPCAIWARQSLGNYDWLLRHFKALLEEYTYRYGKQHSCSLMLSMFVRCVPKFEQLGITAFANCTDYKDIEDTILAYRKQMRDKWQRDRQFARWTRRGQPEWRTLKPTSMKSEQYQLEV